MSTECERQLISRGAKFDFERVTFVGRDGQIVRREVVRHPGAACILPLIEGPGGPEIVLIRVFRVALSKETWELPAGTLDPGEDPGRCALRELEEETGFRADRLIPLGTFHTSPGMSDELMHAFAAVGLKHVGQRLEPDERIVTERVSAGRALQMLDEGQIMDGKSMVTLMLAQRRGLLGAHAKAG